MAVDFTLPPDVEDVRLRVRTFMDTVVAPEEEALYAAAPPGGDPERRAVVAMIVQLRERARAEGVGHIRLEGLKLQRNFRSLPRLVEWANAAFARIFPEVEDLRIGPAVRVVYPAGGSHTMKAIGPPKRLLDESDDPELVAFLSGGEGHA